MVRMRNPAAAGLLFVSALLLVAQCTNPLLDQVKKIDEEYRAELVAPAAPGAPALAPESGQLTATWTAVLGAKSYAVFWHTTEDASAIPAGNGMHVTEATAVITGLVNGILHYVWVKAVNDAGESPLGPPGSGYPGTPPGAPGQPVLVSAENQISVSWTIVSGASSYDVFWSEVNDTGAIPPANTANTTALSHTIGGLANGTAYYVWLKARNAVGPSAFSPVATATPSVPTNPPGTPADVAVIGGDGRISISWAAMPGASGYDVWWHDNNGSPDSSLVGNRLSGTAGLSAVIAGLENGKAWYVWIRARNSLGASSWSPAYGVIPVDTPDIAALIMGDGSFTVSWGASAGASGYDVLWHTENDSSSIPASNLSAVSASPAVVTGLAQGTLYYVWVRARNSGSVSDPSLPASGTTVPAAPAAPAVTPGQYQLGVSWTAVQGAASYDVHWSTSAAFVGSDTRGETGTSTTIAGLENGTLYHVRLTARNAAGTSDFSPASSGTPYVHVTEVALDADAEILRIGAAFQLTATVSPSDATNQALSWTSSDAGVATVDASGLVSAHARGGAVITAHSEDGDVQGTCAVTVPSNQCAMDSFSLLGPAVAGTVDEAAKTVSITIPYEPGGTVGPRIAVFTLSPYAAASVGAVGQQSGATANDFSSPVAYTVTAEDGTAAATYTVTVTMAPGSTGIGILPNPRIEVAVDGLPPYLAYGDDATVLASVSQAVDGYQWYVDGAAQSGAVSSSLIFGASLSYGPHSVAVSVTKNGYRFSAGAAFIVAASASSRIASFSIKDPPAAGTVQESAKTVSVTVPYGTALNPLTAEFSTTGTAVRIGSTEQTSGVTANDFTGPVTYTVTSLGGTAVAYTVTVTVAPNPAKAITAFSFASPSAAGTIDESAGTITVTVPYGTVPGSLVAAFSTTGAGVTVGSTPQASGATANDFTNPVTYTVTAADSTTKTYTVTVTAGYGAVTYDANDSTGGTAPVDSGAYAQGQTVAVPGPGTLVRELPTQTFRFAGWNSAADGSGRTYLPGQTFAMPVCDVTLYAKWVPWALRDVGPAGGLVFYDKGAYSDGWRYLEAAPSDQSAGIQWYAGSAVLINTTLAAVGEGKNNTDEIYALQGILVNYAARLCAELSLGGRDDWFLPSRFELALLCANLRMFGLGDFLTSGSYWSSTESDGSYAYYDYFYNNTADTSHKITAHRVRAVRAFH